MIELVVAMSVFALVAVMGLQSLSGMLRHRDRATEFAQSSAELGRAEGLIRHDLSAVIPVLFYAPGGGTYSAVTTVPDDEGFALSVANTHAYAPLGQTGLVQRVEYRLDTGSGRLLRRVWSTAWPVDEQARSPDIVVLDGVTGLRLRSFWTGVGWMNGLRFAAFDSTLKKGAPSGQDQAGAAPESYSDILPKAVEITLMTEKFGDITLLEVTQ